jgi:toxin YoeB
MHERIVFHSDAFEEFIEWSQQDKKLFNRIVRLIKECQRQPFEGIGKPEPLKYEYTGYWSRRINQEHRLVYKVTDTQIIIASCKFHYS